MSILPIAVRQSLSVPAMEAIASTLARLVQVGDIITLKGDLGSGKTTFARALIAAIAVGAPAVTSPTFNLMQSYDVRLANGREDTLWHLDLYRIKHASELEPLGLLDLLPHILLVEWPDIIEAMVSQERLSVAIDFGETPDSRTIILCGSESWKHRIDKSGI